MKKIFEMVIFIAVAFTFALPVVAFAHTADEPFVTPLIAGGGNSASAITVGEVQVWNDEYNLYVTYLVNDPTPSDPRDNWCLAETHLAISTTLKGIPQAKGNPIPGRFAYSNIHETCVNEQQYTIPLNDFPVRTGLFIAAHGVVQILGGLDGLEAALPATVTLEVVYPYNGGPAYFPETTISGGTYLDGVYYGWCVDTDRTINQNLNYTANVYSSYETLPAGLIEHPENLDLVNWILNQGYIGKISPGGYGSYTYGDVQKAIWTLVDDNFESISGLESWNQNRVNEILASARANGEGFVPGCDDVVAIILVPVNIAGTPTSQIIIAQVILSELGIPCDTESETAWADGSPFPGKNWATYFNYQVQ